MAPPPAPPAATLSHCCAARAAQLPALATGELSWKTKFAIFENTWHLYNMADIDNKEQSELDQDLDDVEEVEEEETGEETKIKARQLTVPMMQNPQILAALQERFDGLVETPTGYTESLPRVVKRRVNALKNLQVKCAQIQAKFYEEVHDLESMLFFISLCLISDLRSLMPFMNLQKKNVNGNQMRKMKFRRS